MTLGKLGLLHLLHQLYGPVSIPSAVHEEVVIRGLEMEQPDAYAVQRGPHLITDDVPAWVCKHCGETLFAAETVEAIQEMLRGT